MVFQTIPHDPGGGIMFVLECSVKLGQDSLVLHHCSAFDRRVWCTDEFRTDESNNTRLMLLPRKCSHYSSLLSQRYASRSNPVCHCMICEGQSCVWSLMIGN